MSMAGVEMRRTLLASLAAVELDEVIGEQHDVGRRSRRGGGIGKTLRR